MWSILAVAHLCIGSVAALGGTPSVAFSSTPNSLLLSGGGQILLSSNDWWGVIKAGSDLATDFGKVTGHNLTFAATNTTLSAASYVYFPVTNNVNFTTGSPVNITGSAYTGNTQQSGLRSTTIIAGTLGSSYVIDNLVASGKIDVSQINGTWEGYKTQIVANPYPGVDKALVVVGSTARGTIFGLYDLSEQIGVSPWWDFADVAPRHHTDIYAIDVVQVQGPPSVKYRGIFINDEQPGLTDWINNNYAPGKYGPGFNSHFYPRIFELLLRLKANYVWPAMWASMFNVDDTANQATADAFGIVMGSSHTEPMMRATNEWGTFGNGQWEYDTNNKSIDHFFEVGAQRARPYVNSLYTMAMRGSGDNAILLTEAEAITAVTDAVTSQREILSRVYNDTAQPDQMWCLYKEVQGYFESGMTVPEDITLLWADDNWGNLRRAPLANETNRVGGAGIYYHVDYVGDPRSYKWINTIQLEKTAEQMQLAYARGADRIWMLNVGDLKGVELPVNHFLDLAYNTSHWGYDASVWLNAWTGREFGSQFSANITAIMTKYGKLAARRKYELVDSTVYSIINYNEVERVLAEWKAIADAAQSIYDTLPSATQPSYFELVLHPVLAGYTVYKIHLGTTRNALYTMQKRTSTNTVAKEVLKDFNQDGNLTNTYHSILNSKWKGVMGQTHLGYTYWQQPMRNTVPRLAWVSELEESVAGNLGVAIEGSNATVPGDDAYHSLSSNVLTLPPLDTYGPSRYIDIFSRGPGMCDWNVTSSVPYLTLSPANGTIGGNGTDTRIIVSIDSTKAPKAPNSTVATVKVFSSCDWGNFGQPSIMVPINITITPSGFEGFVETDRHIAIEAEHTSRNTTNGSVHYEILRNYGRTLSGVTLFPVTADTQNIGTGPVLEYDIYAFTNSTSVPANITLHLSPSLNQNGALRPLKYSIAIDSQTPQTIQFVANATGGALPAGWLGAVSDNIWGLSSGNQTTTSHYFGPGNHTLRIWAVEPGVVFQRVIIDFGGVRQSYLGPPETFRVGVDVV